MTVIARAATRAVTETAADITVTAVTETAEATEAAIRAADSPRTRMRIRLIVPHPESLPSPRLIHLLTI